MLPRPPAATDPLGAAGRRADAWLDASADPEVRRIVLLDGPAVLGWERWREVGDAPRHGPGAALLTELMDAGAMPRQPVEPLAHVLIGALDEAALYVALAEDPDAARAEVRRRAAPPRRRHRRSAGRGAVTDVDQRSSGDSVEPISRALTRSSASTRSISRSM